MNTQIPVTATLDAVKTGENQVKIDVVLKNVPEDLFGAAFHLRAGGVGWALKRFEAGNVFQAEGLRPLILAEEKAGEGDREIVFGISLKRTDAATARDGVLASFYLQTEGDGTLEADFTDAHLSALDESRRDMENVVWKGEEFNLDGLKTQQSALQANVLAPAGARAGGSFLKNDVAGVYIVMLFCLVAILAGTAVYFLLKRRRDIGREGGSGGQLS